MADPDGPAVILVILAVDAAQLRRDQLSVHLLGRRSQPLAAVEIITVPEAGDDPGVILDAAEMAVAGLTEEIETRKR